MAVKKVLVVGAGAAGMSCAEHLSNHPDKFDVTLIEAEDYCGGQAFSIPIDKEKYGAEWMNQGVQGGSPIYHHTMYLFKKYGHKSDPVKLQVSFGKDEKFWTNSFPTQLVQKHAKEIKRFAAAMKVIRWTEVFWALIPIKVSLKMWCFSDDFINYMILPSLALFLGTGNATPSLPTIMMERLYTSPTYGMWYPVDPKSLSSNLPPMIVFPELSKFYGDWQKGLESRGVKLRLKTELTEVIQRHKRKGVTVRIKLNDSSHNPGSETVEQYDEIVLCVLADTARKILNKQASFSESFILGSTKWSDDITITHSDTKYMEKWYTNNFDQSQAVSKLSGRDESARCAEAQKNYKPMYYIKQVPDKPKLLEMAFDCSNFQSQFPQSDNPFNNHVFQTIFLNEKDKQTWTDDEIDKSKIIKENKWHQLMHEWTHYLFVVPWMWLINGYKHTTYAGSWTLVNAHELAIISGAAAAYSLGASYPAELEQDSFALLCFKLYLFLSHFKLFRSSKSLKKN